MADTFSGRPARHGRPGSAGSKAGGKDSKPFMDAEDFGKALEELMEEAPQPPKGEPFS